MKGWLAIIICWMSCTGFAQNQDGIDSLKAKLRTQPYDTNRVLLLCIITQKYYDINWDSANYLATQALQLSQQLSYKRGIAWADLRLGGVSSIRGDFPAAISYFQKSIQLADSLQDYEIVGRGLDNIGYCMYKLEDYYRAIAYYKRALTCTQKSASLEPLTVVFHIDIAMANLASKNLIEAEKSLVRAATWKQEKNPRYSLMLNLFGSLRIEQKRYAEADSILRLAWGQIEKLENVSDRADNRYYFTRLKLAQDEIQTAYRYALEARDYYQVMGRTIDLESIYSLLSAIEAKRGRIQQSLDYLLLSNKLRDSIQNGRARNSALLFEQREQEKQALADQQEKILQQAEKRNQQIIWISSILILGSAASGLLIAMRQKQRSNQKLLDLNEELTTKDENLELANEALRHQQEKIASQLEVIADRNNKLQEANELIAVQNEKINQENENLEKAVKERTNELVEYNQQLEQYSFVTAHNLRGPVARILGLGNVLKISANNVAEREEIIDRMVATTNELDTVINDLNKILEVRKNNTDMYETVDLSAELQRVKENLRSEIEKTQATIQEDFHAVKNLYSIRPYIDSILYNLISNAIKYRNPDHRPVVAIKTNIRNDFVILTVADNGLGFDTEVNKSKLFHLYARFHNHVEGRGMGLYLVKTQVMALNGKISINSKPRVGTVITIVFKQKKA
ncbi:hypothetical protein WSM22_36120 [Cytophagales bacterium WSM2-2]|nr:hypothetical protein WSM22_36120 [Cytophagales bacterium WSM2-2]